MLRFVLVTLRAAYPANMSCKVQFQISASLMSAKIRFLTTRPAKAQMVCFVLVTLRASKPADLSSMQRF